MVDERARDTAENLRITVMTTASAHDDEIAAADRRAFLMALLRDSEER